MSKSIVLLFYFSGSVVNTLKHEKLFETITQAVPNETPDTNNIKVNK